MQALLRWLESRLEIGPALKRALAKRVPPHVDPLRDPRALVYCFGGITFLLILLQFLSGIFLALYYVPAPGHAYESVEYIMKEVPLGWFVRGIHHYGASLIIIMVGLHMLRVYFQGAYKPPRDLNWLAGVALLALVIAFGFTGYLLPWNQKGYWGTVVGTEIVGTIPGIGPSLLRLIRGGEQVGALTLSRFFTIHVFILPLATVVLLGVHFFLVRKHGISGPL